MTEHFKNFFRLVRWFHELLAILPFVALYFIIDHYARKSGIGYSLPGFDFFILCICVQLLIAAGCILNDIMDRRIDAINKPETHLIGRVISLAGAKKLFIALTLLILILSFYIYHFMFKEWLPVCAGVYLLSAAYDVYFKRTPLLGNILIAGLASFIPLVIFFFAKDCIAALHNDNVELLIYLYALFPFLIIIPRELSLDISDMEGDRAGGCKTLPLLIGVKRSKLVVALFIYFTIVVSLFFICRYRHLLLPFLFVDVSLLYYLHLLNRSKNRIDYIRAGRLLWGIMILGLVGFTLSTFYL